MWGMGGMGGGGDGSGGRAAAAAARGVAAAAAGRGGSSSLGFLCPPLHRRALPTCLPSESFFSCQSLCWRGESWITMAKSELEFI